MTRYSDRRMEEVPDRHGDNVRRRTKPADHAPYSPARIEAEYAKGKTIRHDSKQWLGPDHRKNQFPEDQHAKGYDNDVPKGWLRGSGLDGATARPTFDHQPRHQHSLPKGNKATGSDCTKSPFSAAYRRGDGEGF